MTGSGISPASRRSSTTWNGSASRESGSIRSTRRPTSTGATTSPTTPTSTPIWARSRTLTGSSTRRAGGGSGCSSTSSPTTPPTSIRGSGSGPTSTSGRTRCPTTGRRSSAGDPPGRSTRLAGGTTCTTSRRSSRTSTGGTRRSVRSSSGSSASGSTAASPASGSTSPTGSSRIASCATTSESERVHSMNRPETHEVYRDWRRLADAYEPPRVLLGEVYVLDVPAWARYYGSGSDELNLAFNFALVHADLDADADARRSSPARRRRCRPARWPCWIGSNHDVGRLTTRWCGGDEALARCALLMLLTLRGTPSLYYGDELALPDGHVPPDRVRDVAVPSRDPCRTPMPWTREGGWKDPWLPLEDTSRNVEDQRADPGSTLNFTRDLIALRTKLADIRCGPYAELPAPPGAWAWRRGRDVVVGDQHRAGRCGNRRRRGLDRARHPAAAARESASMDGYGSSRPRAPSFSGSGRRCARARGRTRTARP